MNDDHTQPEWREPDPLEARPLAAATSLEEEYHPVEVRCSGGTVRHDDVVAIHTHGEQYSRSCFVTDHGPRAALDEWLASSDRLHLRMPGVAILPALPLAAMSGAR